MTEGATLARLREQFMSAAVDPRLWPVALRSLADATHSSFGQLIGYSRAGGIDFNFAPDLDPVGLARFAEMGGGDPQVNYRVATAEVARPLEIQSERHYDLVRRRMRGDYNDFVATYDVADGLSSRLMNASDSVVGLAVLRTSSDGRSTERDQALFAAVAPIALAAIKTQIALEKGGDAILAGTFEAMDAAAFVCDRGGRVRAMTPAAEALLKCGLWLRLAQGQLLPRLEDREDDLRDAVARVLEPGGPGQAHLLLERPDGERMAVQVTRLPRQAWSLGFGPQVLIVLRARKPVDLAVLQDAFKLTRAEAEVADGLQRGLSRQQIAAARGVSTDTIKTQMKVLFEKVGVSRTAELVVMLRDLG